MGNGPLQQAALQKYWAAKPADLSRFYGLEKDTHFDAEEIYLLSEAWLAWLHGGYYSSKAAKPRMTFEKFSELMPVLDCDRSRKAVWKCMIPSVSKKDTVGFKKSVRFLSRISRAALEEKLRAAFDIFDLDGDESIQYSEARVLGIDLFRGLKPDEATYPSPQITLDRIFKYYAEKSTADWEDYILTAMLRKIGADDRSALENSATVKRDTIELQLNNNKQLLAGLKAKNAPADEIAIVVATIEMLEAASTRSRAVLRKTVEDAHREAASLNWKEFRARVSNDPNFYLCFGLFDHAILRFIQPIDQFLRPADLPAVLQGDLMKAGTLLRTEARHCMVQGGFFIAYHETNNKPRHVIPLQLATLDATHKDSSFRITAPTEQLAYKVPDAAKFRYWLSAIKAGLPATTRYNSFAPVRENIAAEFFINARPYFAALATSLRAARSHIYIADWFLSPHVYLVRPETISMDDRLDSILKKKAQEGVKIRVLLWDETNLAFPLWSEKAKELLEGLHPNILVTRHPKYVPMTWSHHQKFVSIDGRIAFVGGLDLTWGRFDDEHFHLFDPDSKTWLERDYVNLILTQTEAGGFGQPCQLDRSKEPRMPWHDIHSSVSGAAAQDVEMNFVQRWNHALFSNKESDPRYELFGPIAPPASLPAATGTCRVQVLRSAGEWSAGLTVTEDSIYKAMIDLIHSSKHYIFIENQYFISSTRSNHPLPHNKIALALLERLRRAMSQRETFRVIVVLPLFPAGSLLDLGTRYVLKWVYNTIHAKEDSLLKQLASEFPGVPLDDYICFFNLRNHGQISGRWCTHQVYVHSKLMLVDDTHVLIGSANINDRSLMGSRDSELAVLIEDTNLIPSTMNGKPYNAAAFAYNFRIQLWGQLLASSAAKLADPTAHKSYTRWSRRAARNTAVYRSVYKHIEDLATQVSTWEPICWAEGWTPEQLRDKHRKVKGYIVSLAEILSKETDMHPTLFTKEYFVEVDTFL